MSGLTVFLLKFSCVLNLPGTGWCLICRCSCISPSKPAKQITQMKDKVGKNKQCLQCSYIFFFSNRYGALRAFCLQLKLKKKNLPLRSLLLKLCYSCIRYKCLPSKMFLRCKLLCCNGYSEIRDLRSHRCVTYKGQV